jgi:cell filamentation protein
MAARYEAEGPEAEFEAGSRGRVLRNRLGIKSVREIERKESEALLAATEQMIDETLIDQCFTPDYIRRMHRVWLGEVYVWAGEYRQVNMAKGEFMFAAANQIPKLMHEFGRGPLRDFTPCLFAKEEELATALAVVHAARFAKETDVVADCLRPSWRCNQACRRWILAGYEELRRVNTSRLFMPLWAVITRR